MEKPFGNKLKMLIRDLEAEGLRYEDAIIRCGYVKPDGSPDWVGFYQASGTIEVEQSAGEMYASSPPPSASDSVKELDVSRVPHEHRIAEEEEGVSDSVYRLVFPVTTYISIDFIAEAGLSRQAAIDLLEPFDYEQHGGVQWHEMEEGVEGIKAGSIIPAITEETCYGEFLREL